MYNLQTKVVKNKTKFYYLIIYPKKKNYMCIYIFFFKSYLLSSGKRLMIYFWVFFSTFYLSLDNLYRTNNLTSERVIGLTDTSYVFHES